MLAHELIIRTLQYMQTLRKCNKVPTKTGPTVGNTRDPVLVRVSLFIHLLRGVYIVCVCVCVHACVCMCVWGGGVHACMCVCLHVCMRAKKQVKCLCRRYEDMTASSIVVVTGCAEEV